MVNLDEQQQEKRRKKRNSVNMKKRTRMILLFIAGTAQILQQMIPYPYEVVVFVVGIILGMLLEDAYNLIQYKRGKELTW